MNLWKPILGEVLHCRTEPENPVDKYAVAVLKNKNIVGHLPIGKSGRFAKTIFYFLRADSLNIATVKVEGKRQNYGDGEGLQIPCSIQFKGETKSVEILKKQLIM